MSNTQVPFRKRVNPRFPSDSQPYLAYDPLTHREIARAENATMLGRAMEALGYDRKNGVWAH